MCYMDKGDCEVGESLCSEIYVFIVDPFQGRGTTYPARWTGKGQASLARGENERQNIKCLIELQEPLLYARGQTGIVATECEVKNEKLTCAP